MGERLGETRRDYRGSLGRGGCKLGWFYWLSGRAECMGLEDQCVSGHALIAQGELRGVVVGVQIFRARENSEFYFCNANV